MKQELIRPVVRVGNSAGVILPKEWLNGQAKVRLIEKPIDVRKDVMEILSPYLDNVMGIYLVGSYARGEETVRSDVDVLVITNKIDKRIERGKYNLLLISKERLEDRLKKNILPLLPMLREAKSIMNASLIEEYKKTKLTKVGLKKHIELSKSALAIDREMIRLDKEWPSNCSDAVAYSLILNLRTAHIVNKLRRNRNISNKEIKSLIKNVAGSLKAYDGYLRVKNDKKEKEDLPVKEADKLYNYIIKELGEIERWLKGKRD